MNRALAFLIFFAWSAHVSALQCVYVLQKGSDVPTLPVAGYDLVFSGTVTQVAPVMRNDGKGRLAERMDATFAVERTWQGGLEPGETVVISSRQNPIQYDRTFKPGQRAIVLASRLDGLWISPACSPPRGGEDEASLIRRIESEYGESE